MSIMNILVLTTAISVGSRSVASGDSRKALQYTSKAIYKAADLDKITNQLESKYLPKIIRNNPWAIILIKAGVEQKLSAEWRF